MSRRHASLHDGLPEAETVVWVTFFAVVSKIVV